MKKNHLIYGLSFMAVAFACAGTASVQAVANGEEGTPTYTLTESDITLPGASIRMVGDNKNGIRFAVRILLEDYTSNESFIAKTGTLVLPADSYTQSTDFTLTGAESNTKILNNETTEKWFIREETKDKVTTKYAETLTYMYNIPQEHLDTDFYVRGYVTMTDGTTVYSSVENRSMSYVADAALKSGEYEASRTTLEGYLAEYTVSFSESSLQAQTVKYGQKATDPAYSSDVFLYWTADGKTEFDFATEIKSDVALTAVKKQEIALEGAYDIDVINANETLKIANLDGTVESITIGEKTATATYEKGVLKANLSSMGLKTEVVKSNQTDLAGGADAKQETATVKIATTTSVYTLTATLWARVVSNATELQAMLDVFNANTTTMNVDADYCLDADINAEEVGATKNATRFFGIWDGKGHVISNLASPSCGTSNGGFVERTARSATIKNIAFVGGTGERCYLVARMGGIIENVYVQATIKYTTSNYGVIQKLEKWSSADYDKATIKNCVFNVTMTNATSCNGLGGVIGLYTAGTLENVYAINNSVNTMGSYPLYLSANKVEKITDFSTAKGFAGESAFLSDNTVAFSAEKGWASYWKMENGKLYFNKTPIIG